MPLEFHLFLPQMRLSFDALVARAQAAEAAGFTGIALMDHLAPPMAEDQSMYEAMVTATWLAARTERLTISHLVLCDAFRHPAVLARQAVSIDHASGGRFELGIGWGSVPTEFGVFGVGSMAARDRVTRLAETLDVVTALWSGQPVDYEGEYHRIEKGQHVPVPLTRIPIVIGGVGKKTLALVAKHADWWNVPIHELRRMEEMRPQAGDAKVSIQQMVTFIGDESRRDEIEATAGRRFGYMRQGRTTGSAAELVDHFGTLAGQGVERVYAWFTDFADPDTLAGFAEVIGSV